MRGYNLFLTIILCVVFFSCVTDTKTKYEFSIMDSEEKEKRDSLIRENIYSYIINNSDKDIIKAYLYITENKNETIRFFDENYFVGFNKDSIRTGFSKNFVQISPIPTSYKVHDGKKAEYMIINSDNEKLDSFVLSFLLDKDLTVKDAYLIISYKNSVLERNNTKKIHVNDKFDFSAQWSR